MESVVLKISGLNFAYAQSVGSSWGLRELSLQVRESEIVCILGASGCGKSTLLNLIAKLLQPQSGVIEIVRDEESGAGEDPGAPRKTEIGYIFQDDALFPWRTVESNLMIASQVSKHVTKQEARERIKQYLRTFHLNDQILKQYPSQLSGGMRQRVSIIQSLLFNPKILLLDEPFSALDFYTKLRLEDEFFQLVKQEKMAAILVTHDIEEAVAMGDRVLIMDKLGRLSDEIAIQFANGDRLPESVRGTAEFAEYYRTIWSQLKSVIAS